MVPRGAAILQKLSEGVHHNHHVSTANAPTAWSPSNRPPSWIPGRGHPLTGPAIRQATLLVLLATRRTMTVPQIHRLLCNRGSPVASTDPHEAIRRGLAIEVARGRARRQGRGRYEAGVVPSSSRYLLADRFPWLA